MLVTLCNIGMCQRSVLVIHRATECLVQGSHPSLHNAALPADPNPRARARMHAPHHARNGTRCTYLLSSFFSSSSVFQSSFINSLPRHETFSRLLLTLLL